MASKALPSPEALRQLLDYNPETGDLTWRTRAVDPKRGSSWNTRYAGKPAFTYVMKNGYLQGAVNDVLTTAHRVIWAIQTGFWPDGDIDHIDGNRANNRWANLRQASRSENNKNRKPIVGRSSKYLGVSLIKRNGMWDARITTDQGQICLGHYRCEVEAAKAYDQAARKYHGEFARPNFTEVGNSQ